MRRAIVIPVTVLGLMAIGLLMVITQPPKEPVSEGKPLSYWLGRLDQSLPATPRTLGKGEGVHAPSFPQPDFAARQTASGAIKEIGTNALPELTDMLRRRDSPERKRFVSWVSHHPWLKSKLKFGPPEEQDWRLALDGIRCLGPAGQAALADILPLMTNQDTTVAHEAFFAFTAIGPETEHVKPILPALLQALKDPQWTMRIAAMNALAALRPPPPEAAQALVHLTQDPNGMVSEAAMDHLASQTNPVVLPALEKRLDERDAYVVAAAASRLGLFGASAKASVPRLTQLLDDPLITVRQAATNALAAITGKPPAQSALAEKAMISFNFPGAPLGMVLDIYESLSGKKVTMAATPNPGQSLRVQTPAPLTTNAALQLLEEVLKNQAGLVIVHGKDASLTAVAKQ